MTENENKNEKTEVTINDILKVIANEMHIINNNLRKMSDKLGGKR